MKNIMFIFKRDMKNLVTNIFAFLIAGGLCFIPSLYAWFNIYSNWDPYANTSAVNIAVFSEDEGYTDEDGNYSNIGEQVLESVKKSTSIGWVFTDTKDEAIEGVKSGKYYAAVIINNSFTYNIYNISKQDYKNPTITYYENSKKNAVAAKITDTAVSTLKTSINASLIKTMAGTVFDKTNVVADKLSNSESIDNMISEVEEISDKLTQMSTTIDTFISNNNELVQSMSDMKSQIPLINDRIDSGINKLNQTKTQFTTSTQDADSFASELSAMTDSISQSADTIRQTLNNAKIDEGLDTVKTSISMALNDTKNLENDLNTLVKAVINENTGIAASDTIQNIKNYINQINQILSQIEVNLDITPDITGDSIKKILDNSITQVDNLKKIYNNSLKPQLLTLTNNMTTVIDDVNTFLTGIASTVNGVSDVINGTDTTVNNINDSLIATKQVVDDVNNKLQSAINEMRDKDYDEKKEILINLLSGDPKTLSEFFSEPVKVHTELIYEIANYGSGVAPFYTVLAIWVGALVLVSLIKVDADKKGLDNPKLYELFFGRYLLFFLLGQVQTVICVLGDIYLLKCQVVYPGLFLLASCLTSLTFTLLIYALTISFGDVGKAISVVMIVLQIAGSGGTYPIEILPSFYQAVYIFFPFPYAINALRETVGGMYGDTYVMSILQLLIFAVASLLLGLVIRKPFIKVNHFMEKRMKDTKMM